MDATALLVSARLCTPQIQHGYLRRHRPGLTLMHHLRTLSTHAVISTHRSGAPHTLGPQCAHVDVLLYQNIHCHVLAGTPAVGSCAVKPRCTCTGGGCSGALSALLPEAKLSQGDRESQVGQAACCDAPLWARSQFTLRQSLQKCVFTQSECS